MVRAENSRQCYDYASKIIDEASWTEMSLKLFGPVSVDKDLVSRRNVKEPTGAIQYTCQESLNGKKATSYSIFQDKRLLTIFVLLCIVSFNAK